MTFDQALALGARAAPVQVPARELAARAAGDPGIGGTAQATTITLMPGAVVAPQQESGFEMQASITQGWNLADLGSSRRRAAAEERAVLAAQVRAEALRARLEAARRWIELAASQGVEQVLIDASAIAAERVARSERALEAGVGDAASLATARAAQAEIAQARLDAEGERFTAGLQLAAAMGEPGRRDLVARGSLPSPALPDLESARASLRDLDALPDLAVRRLAASAARAREVEVRAGYAPILSVGAQVERGASDAWVVYGIASLSFSAFGQEDRAASEASGAAEREEARLDVARDQARTELEDALHEVEHTREQLEALDHALLPALQTLADRRRLAMERGEGTVFEHLDAQARLTQARALRVRSLAARVWAEVRLWLHLAEVAGARS